MIVLLAIGWGYHVGGSWGAYSMFLISGIILGCCVNPPEGREESPTMMDEGVPARRGKRVDPTRPTQDDYAAMITDNYGKRRK